jgi:hypothetical protein
MYVENAEKGVGASLWGGQATSRWWKLNTRNRSLDYDIITSSN